jgi:predicted dehydrogenase
MAISRRQFLGTSAAATAAVWSASWSKSVFAQDTADIRIAVVGFNSQGHGHIEASHRNIVALCDVDERVLDKTAKEMADKYGRKVEKFTDFRRLLERKDIDAVSVATPNHIHAWVTVLAAQAGKDVYVEKPASHDIWEGRQMVAAARKHNRVIQCGTQSRSSPSLKEAVEWVQGGGLGKILYAIGTCYKPRQSIGKIERPLEIPKHIHYDLWCGPAEKKDLYRPKLHYDWHWDWNTGNGEMGNWGVHVIDDAVNVVLRDRVPFPKRLLAAGGRVAWDDAGESPNVCFAYYDTGSIPVLFGLTNLPSENDAKESVKYLGVGSGYIVHCEGGYYAGGRGGGAAHDRDGKVIRRFKGDSGAGHARNFVDSVAARDRKRLNAEVKIGHASTAWCNLVNIACRVGGEYADEKTRSIGSDVELWPQLVGQAHEHLQRNGVDIAKSEFKISPVLEFDSEREQFVGESADAANQLLRREYRPEFKLPSIA